MASSSSRWIVVVDTTNTILHVAENELAAEIPAFSSGIKYAIWTLNANPREAIENDFRALLLSCGQQKTSAENQVRGQDEKALPVLLVRWLTGQLTPQAFASQVSMHAEHEIFTIIAQSIVDPSRIAKHTYAITGAGDFLAQCAQLLGNDAVYIAGNWDRFSFPLIRHNGKTQTIFSHVPLKNQLISGHICCALPCGAEQIFNMIATQAGVHMDHIIFVSGMRHHVVAAHKIGLRAIHLQQRNFTNAYAAIQKLIGTAV